MLGNWHVRRVDAIPDKRQSPDYYLKNGDYWFFKHFREKPEVDIIDVKGSGLLDYIERKVYHVHIIQGIKAILKMHKYDLVISHGMTSGIVLAAFRTLFHIKKPKHLVFDIGCFNSAAESGFIMRVLQRASKSIDAIIYHTKCQKEYYEKYYPWIFKRSRFIFYGTNIEEFVSSQNVEKEGGILCIGYVRRDWDTLVKAYSKLVTDKKLKIVGHLSDEYKAIPGVEQFPVVSIDKLKLMIESACFCVLPLEVMRYSYGQMTLLQQMAMEKCVIAADVPSLEGYVEDGKTALLYRPNDIEDLKNKMEYALKHPDEIRRIGFNARKVLVERCNEQIMAQEIEDYIRFVMMETDSIERYKMHN